MFRVVRTVAIVLVCAAQLQATDPDRNFSGKWILDARRSTARVPNEASLTVVQQEALLKITAAKADGGGLEWTYDLNGASTRYRVGEENRNSKTKWEGAALL